MNEAGGSSLAFPVSEGNGSYRPFCALSGSPIATYCCCSDDANTVYDSRRYTSAQRAPAL